LDEPDIERVQALADISRSALYAFAVQGYKLTYVFVVSNEIRAPIANPPKSAQLDCTPYYSPKLHPGPCSSVGMRRGTRDRQTDTETRRQPWPIYISPRLCLARNVMNVE